MLNYFNFKDFENGYLITNDFGRHLYLRKEEFRSFISGHAAKDPVLYDRLKEELFVFEESPCAFADRNKDVLRLGKRYLFGATSLHIFVLTNACNMRCAYCQAQSAHGGPKGLMSRETAEKAAALALSSPEKYISIEFQGGEPLLNFEAIKAIVSFVQVQKGRKEVSYQLVSNLTLLTEEMAQYIADHGISVTTSIDGTAAVQDLNRPYDDGSSSLADTLRGIALLRAVGVGVSAIETTTRYNFGHEKELVAFYRELGCNSLFLRPLTPLGFAHEAWDTIGYAPEEFGTYYKSVLEEIFHANQAGFPITEGHAGIFLAKILRGDGGNYMELRSPCGAGTGQMAYYHDGNIFTCDEGRMLHEMGDSSFLLGNVNSSDYESLLSSPVCKTVCAASLLETNLECCDCVYQPYCGTCPVVNLSIDKDIFRKTPRDYRCRTYMGILDTIFACLQDETKTEIMKGWVR
jgi:His-Xaa-Ser system radical SAM maturase HxsB